MRSQGRQDRWRDVRTFLFAIFKAVEEQLGLKLERKDSPVQIIVIDSLEKTPVANYCCCLAARTMVSRPVQ